MTRYQVTCPCGYSKTSKTPALADYGLRAHSCERHRALADRRARGTQIRARQEANRTPRPCPHGGRHTHGSHACYVLDRCRCRPCTDANTTYERRRTRNNAYGRPPYVDATPARQHVTELQAQRLGLKRIATLAGVPHGSLAKLMYGDAQRGLAPSKRIRPSTEAKILAVTAELDNLARGAFIDATGTRRRIQALVWLGWSQSAIAARTGMNGSNFGAMLRRQQVSAATARTVRAVYDDLWRTRPPETNKAQRQSVARSRNYAQRHGWKPPMWWGDDIDDPTCSVPDAAAIDVDVDEVAVERAMNGDPEAAGALTRQERREAVRLLHERGTTPTEIARRLRMSGDSVNKALGLSSARTPGLCQTGAEGLAS